MGKYNKLLSELEEEKIDVFDYIFDNTDTKGLAVDNVILINKKLVTNAERYCIAKEEQGHVKLTVGDIRDQSNISNRKQEKKARTWGYLTSIGVVDLITAYRYGVRNLFEMAEYLEVTEEFLNETIKTMGEKYGSYYKIDDYIIYFSPFGILRMGEF